MEKLRMYNPVKKEEEKEPLKTPLLTIRARYFCAVNEEGERLIPYLQDLESGAKPIGVKGALAKRGFRTDWARWTDFGAFDGLIEDVEG